MINLLTLVFILSLVLITQVLVLFFQYKVIRNYHGIGSWLLGVSLVALAFMFMLMINMKSLHLLARIANPLLISGHIFLYIGIKQFFNHKVNKWIPISIFVIFNLFYYYYMFINNNVTARTLVITVTIAIISFMIAYTLFFKKDRRIYSAANFTASVFLVYGSFYLLRTFRVFMASSLNSYLDQRSILVAGFVLSIIISNLWTFGFILMINERLHKDNQLEKEKLQFIFNASPDNIITTDLEGNLLMLSPAGKKMFAYEPDFDDFTGMQIFDFIIPEDVERAKSNLKQMYQKNSLSSNEYRGLRQDQSTLDLEVNSGIVYNANGFPAKMIFIIRDITERKQKEHQIQNLVQQLEIEKKTAYYNSITDSLTGLANRGFFDETLKKEFLRLKRSGLALSLIMLDIDYFKKFNDAYGHVAGDQCLQMIADTLKTIVGRSSDFVARYGGEEFIVILPETEESGAKILGEKIRKAIESLAIPHSTSGVSKYVTTSLGIVTVYPSELTSPSQILQMVDDALYRAKKGGRNRCVFSSNIKKDTPSIKDSIYIQQDFFSRRD